MNEIETMQLELLNQELVACRLCLEAGHTIAPGPIFSHPVDAKVMLIGQAPGITEVDARRPFNAGSGKRLFQWLGKAGWQEDDFRVRHAMTAVTKCYPGKAGNGKGDRVPSTDEQKLCRPFLERELKIYNPRLTLLVGGVAIKLLYPAKLKLVEIIGTAACFPDTGAGDLLNLNYRKAELVNHPAQINELNGCWIVPLPHPSGASLWPNKLQNKALIERAIEILYTIRERYRL
ncbi:MAG: uracil-DNA glycosylase family protein [Candidatus Promineifilaceae bacterium]|nr:uracil-DNA glycosylase family protein [Candidatus Promineifilaceae bacterium]